MSDPRSVLDALPRVSLGHLPTPLERCERLSDELGIDLWLKRDDCTGLALGGNKTRKLEFLLGDAIARGAETVLTYGAMQSNHARQTAAACAKLGLRCELLLAPVVDRHDDHYERSGNVLLDRVLGARINANDLGSFYEIPPGGSNVTGVMGYVAGGLELAAQAREHGLRIGRIVVAASTAGTAAGLALGCAVAGLDARVDVVCVYEPADVTRASLDGLVTEAASKLSVDIPSNYTVSDAQLGDGYGIPTTACFDAIGLVARTEGVLLDPVYTGKAFAHLTATADPSDGSVVFVHTGGAPGLFAYAPEITQATQESNRG